MIQVDSKLPLPRMLINSGLFNYSSLKPWHFEPINTVAEGERPRVRQIVPCPRLCACVRSQSWLCWCLVWPPAATFKNTACVSPPSGRPNQQRLRRRWKRDEVFSEKKTWCARTSASLQLSPGLGVALTSRWPHVRAPDLPLSSVLAMRRAALSDCRLRFLSRSSTSRGLEGSWARYRHN